MTYPRLKCEFADAVSQFFEGHMHAVKAPGGLQKDKLCCHIDYILITSIFDWKFSSLEVDWLKISNVYLIM